jgi:regulatory protein
MRIREELTQRGLARSDIEQALRDSGIDWQAQLHAVWQRKFAGERPLDARQHGQQARFLSYRGYPADLISRLLRGAIDD